MKKIIGIILVTLVLLAMNAAGQDIWPRHKSIDLLNVRSLVISNTINVTNLTFAGAGTNVAGTEYTNRAGTKVVTTASSGTNYNLLGSAELWCLQDGSPLFTANTNSLPGAYAAGPSYLDISYDLVGGSGANSACTFILSPSWDGVNVDTSGGYDFTFAVTATTTTAIKSKTNAPAWKWIGAKRLFVRSLSNADTDASSAVTIRSLKLNGFGPP